MIALTETRTSWGNEYTYPANRLAEQFAEISGQKTLSAYTISRMERMGVKVMNELEYYKQQAGVENCEGEVDEIDKSDMARDIVINKAMYFDRPNRLNTKKEEHYSVYYDGQRFWAEDTLQLQQIVYKYLLSHRIK